MARNNEEVGGEESRQVCCNSTRLVRQARVYTVTFSLVYWFRLLLYLGYGIVKVSLQHFQGSDG